MIRPRIHHFHSPDVEDLDAARPAVGSDFSVLVQIFVGPEGGEGFESFDIQIVTPGWLHEECASDGFASGEHRLIVFDYDWPRIENYLRKRIAACSGRDWTEVAHKIGRFAWWEFEDYEPYEGGRPGGA